MKAVIEIYDDEQSTIVEISKKIVGQSRYERLKSLVQFYTKEVKELENAIDYVILEIMSRYYGIVPTGTTKEDLISAIEIMKAKYGKTFIIEDRYQDTKEIVVHRAHKQTCIMDNDIVSIANEIKIVDAI